MFTRGKALGPSLGIEWSGASKFYAGTGYALSVYDIDITSHARGQLQMGAKGYGHSLNIEGGRHLGLGENVNLTPRIWSVGSRVSMGDFMDAVNSRVSIPDSDRLMGGGGVVTEAARDWGDGSFSMRGSVDIERMFSGAATTTYVSGESLSLEAAKNSILVSLSAVYRQGLVSLTATAWLREVLDSRAKEYSGMLTLGIGL